MTRRSKRKAEVQAKIREDGSRGPVSKADRKAQILSRIRELEESGIEASAITARLNRKSTKPSRKIDPSSKSGKKAALLEKLRQAERELAEARQAASVAGETGTSPAKSPSKSPRVSKKTKKAATRAALHDRLARENEEIAARHEELVRLLDEELQELDPEVAAYAKSLPRDMPRAEKKRHILRRLRTIEGEDATVGGTGMSKAARKRALVAQLAAAQADDALRLEKLTASMTEADDVALAEVRQLLSSISGPLPEDPSVLAGVLDKLQRALESSALHVGVNLLLIDLSGAGVSHVSSATVTQTIDRKRSLRAQATEQAKRFEDALHAAQTKLEAEFYTELGELGISTYSGHATDGASKAARKREIVNQLKSTAGDTKAERKAVLAARLAAELADEAAKQLAESEAAERRDARQLQMLSAEIEAFSARVSATDGLSAIQRQRALVEGLTAAVGAEILSGRKASSAEAGGGAKQNAKASFKRQLQDELERQNETLERMSRARELGLDPTQRREGTELAPASKPSAPQELDEGEVIGLSPTMMNYLNFANQALENLEAKRKRRRSMQPPDAPESKPEPVALTPEQEIRQGWLKWIEEFGLESVAENDESLGIEAYKRWKKESEAKFRALQAETAAWERRLEELEAEYANMSESEEEDSSDDDVVDASAEDRLAELEREVLAMEQRALQRKTGPGSIGKPKRADYDVHADADSEYFAMKEREEARRKARNDELRIQKSGLPSLSPSKAEPNLPSNSMLPSLGISPTQRQAMGNDLLSKARPGKELLQGATALGGASMPSTRKPIYRGGKLHAI